MQQSIYIRNDQISKKSIRSFISLIFQDQYLGMKKLFGLGNKKSQETLESKGKNNQPEGEKSNSTKKRIFIYIPPIIIDDVTFSTTNVKSQKVIPKIQKQLLSIYDKDYLKQSGRERLCIQIVRQQDFPKILRTTQKSYNYYHISGEEDTVSGDENQLRKKLQNVNLLKHFWSIDFCKLRIMNLSGHNLRSVEGFTFMQLPHLVCLELHTNEITSIDCLSKMSLSKLRILTLYNNKITSSNTLCRSKLPQLSHMEFDYQDQSYDSKVQNIHFIFKMQQQNLEKLYLHDDDRIMSKNIYRNLDKFFMRGQYLKTSANRFMWRRRNNDIGHGWGRQMFLD